MRQRNVRVSTYRLRCTGDETDESCRVGHCDLAEAESVIDVV